MDEPKIKAVSITLTQSCNLACVYCYEQHKSSQIIPVDTAKRIIDKELAGCDNYDHIELDFFGGEPFLAFDEIRELTNYIEQKQCPIPVIVFATTNGTLVHGEVQDWLRSKQGKFVCGLSLDGTREMHNLNRSNSYDDIDLDFFLELYPEQDVKMTISKETLPNLAAGVIDMHNKGFLVSCNLAYGIDWSDPANTAVLECELNKLIAFYLEHPDIEPCSMLNMGISSIGASELEAVRFCGAGLSMHSYDVDGKAYPCQFFMPLSVGPEKAAAASNIQFPENIIPENCLDEKCRACILRSICPNCFGANYAATGNIYQRDNNMCRLTKITMKARSFFRAKQWESGQLHLTPTEEQLLLRAIIRIQEELEV